MRKHYVKEQGMADAISNSSGSSWTQGIQVAGTIMSAQGSLNSADASRASGDAQNVKAQYEAAQMRVNAGQAQAAGHAEMQTQLLQSKLLQSRALAIAGASGAGALDPNVVDVISGISKVGKYNADMTSFNAASRAKAMLDQASATEYSGRQAKAAGDVAAGVGRFAAVGTILKGAKSMYDLYNTSTTDNVLHWTPEGL